jgi:hypothetical protein
MTDSPLSFVKDNMEQGEFLSFAAWGSIKAFVSVLIIISAFISTSYLLSLRDNFVILNLIMYLAIFVPGYIWITKISSFKEFFITDKIDFDDNCVFLLKMEAATWILITIVHGIVFIVSLFLSAWDDPLSQAIFKIMCLSLITTSFFVYTKRDEVWTATGFDLTRFIHYLIMGITFGIGTYALGGIIIISSSLIGWSLTVLGIGLEIILASVYTYMDLQNWVKDYKRRQLTKEDVEEREREQKDGKEIASRLGGKFGNV